ncbi:DNA polymerase III subunit gamma/tau [Thiomicrorhabdus sp.]|uniref:DNA polymerase III subunit gamma/tau n=1 Tax=Thiomicrorhabdus sp. TaxID=2039724 RepID=UPI003568400D
MSYTVLARKWRPKNFDELVGQTHVMQALSNALDQNRLHHAYLFTGTRGVGKTTIARIFSKALNCQEGISSHPCGVCDTCKAIDEGRFIDLIEVDAASRTKVDDTREILDNVQFAPTQGRYKVYLIDEVHMLSKSSFNALLKTLEEPPEHVKFLLATTDPHKLPITVLSRCLQFNLMRLTQTQIQNHLEYILQQENLPYESSALALIAKSADGSARDALSLLDQAIAYGAGQIMFEPVQMMLGLVDQQYTVAILQALAEDSAAGMKEVIQQLALMGVDYSALLAQLIETLHALAFKQVLGELEGTSTLPAEILEGLSQLLSPQRVQMLYQIALLAKQDMQLAPDLRIGFEMALLRMLAFQPADAPMNDQDSGIQGRTQSSAGVQEANLQEADPQEVLAGLSSARALMAKKNSVESTVANNQQPVVAESKVDHAQVTAPEFQKEPQVQESQVPQYDVPQYDFEQHNVQPDNVPQQNLDTGSIQATDQFSMPQSELPVQEAPPWHVEEAASVAPVTSQTSAPLPTTEDSASGSDHLAQIKQRLKQPLGKPQVNSPAPVVEENSISLPFAQEEVDAAPSEERQPGLSISLMMANAEMTAEAEPVSEAATSAQESMYAGMTPGVMPEEPLPKLAEQFEEVDRNSMSVSESMPEIVAGNHSESQATNTRFEMAYETLTDANRGQVWLNVLERLQPEGMAAELARQSILVSYSPEMWVLSVDPEQAFAKTDMAVLRLTETMQQAFGQGLKLEFAQANQHDTPAKYAQRQAEEKQQKAEASIMQDRVVSALTTELGMEVIQSSIAPL